MLDLRKTVLLILATSLLFVSVVSFILPVFPGATFFMFMSVSYYRKGSERIARIKFLKTLEEKTEIKVNNIKTKISIIYNRLLLKYYF